MYANETFINGSPGLVPWLDSLIWGGMWISPNGPTTISIAAVNGDDPYGYLSGTSLEWSSEGLSALDLALDSWEAVASINFVEVAFSDADVWFWQGTNEQAFNALGWSDVPGYSYGEPLFTVFNGEHFTWSSEALVVGGYGYITIIHELGHLLGLAHPHDGGYDGDLFPGVETSFGDYGNDDLNQGIFTTMSYNDGWATEYSEHADMSYGWQGTPMALDIAAIQYIYGANYDYNTGSNTYTLPESNASGTFWSCIWDAGGSDTISYEGHTGNCNINLNEAPLIGANAGGYVSWVPGVIGGYTIAYGAVIENATGGLGNDTIVGNSSANSLDGRSGSDILLGGSGNDTYYVDNAGDNVYETTTTSSSVDATGTDLVSSSVSFDLNAYDGVKFVENLTLTGSSNINATGNSLSNQLTGNSKNNTLNGGAGADIMLGGSGNDTYYVDNAGDNVYETTTTSSSVDATGTDLVSSSVSFDLNAYDGVKFVENLTLTGSSNINATGNSLSNQLTGNSKNNTLNGGAGADIMLGGSGADKFVFDSALSASTNLDTIKDFVKGTDKIVLDDDIFMKFLNKTSIAAGNLITGTKAVQADDYLIYNTSNDTLYYDADGSGSKFGLVAFAKIELVGTAAPTAKDFQVIA